MCLDPREGSKVCGPNPIMELQSILPCLLWITSGEQSCLHAFLLAFQQWKPHLCKTKWQEERGLKGKAHFGVMNELDPPNFFFIIIIF